MQVYLWGRQFLEYIMHELSLAMNVREIVEEAAKANGSSCVREVNIVVGAFSSVVPDALEFAMDVAKKGSVFENAAINIRLEDTVVLCADCNSKTKVDDYFFRCANCGSGNVKVVAGDRMYVESIDIEK